MKRLLVLAGIITFHTAPYIENIQETKIAFKKGKNIHITDSNGKNEVKIVELGKDESFVGNLYWSPNGKQILYKVLTPGASFYDIYVIDYDLACQHFFVP